MKFLKKKWLNLLLILCIISMISIGFSSWSINKGSGINTGTGSILTDDVESFSDYIELKNELNVFKYYDNGFITNSYFIGDEAHIIANFKINIENCKSKFAGKSSLKLELILKYKDDVNTGLNLFLNEKNANGEHKLSSKVSCENVKYTEYPAFGQENKNYTIAIFFDKILESDLNEVEFSVDYCFFVTHGDYFKNNIFEELKKIEFAMGITLEGVK